MPAPDSPTGTITLRGPQEKLGQGNYDPLNNYNIVLF